MRVCDAFLYDALSGCQRCKLCLETRSTLDCDAQRDNSGGGLVEVQAAHQSIIGCN